jgi:DNA invertase Pin-like site-specific DNA recombinase
MKKGVPYIRVSTDQQGLSKLGLEAQQQAVQQYALANKIELIGQFVEIESGRKSNRPILQKALAYCRKNNALLIIAKLDRLGRSVAFISSLMETRVKFVAVDNPNANDFIIHIMAAFAQYEREQISIRTKEALAAAKRRGVKLGEQAKKLSNTNKYKAEQFAQQMIPVIDKLKAEGFSSVRKITMELNKRKILAFRQGSKWYKSSVHNLLTRIDKLNEYEH